jgi:hypothetical protein
MSTRVLTCRRAHVMGLDRPRPTHSAPLPEMPDSRPHPLRVRRARETGAKSKGVDHSDGVFDGSNELASCGALSRSAGSTLR